jgi:hypothetical protein
VKRKLEYDILTMLAYIAFGIVALGSGYILMDVILKLLR